MEALFDLGTRVAEAQEVGACQHPVLASDQFPGSSIPRARLFPAHRVEKVDRAPDPPPAGTAPAPGLPLGARCQTLASGFSRVASTFSSFFFSRVNWASWAGVRS